MEIKDQMELVKDYIGFTPYGYIARCGVILGFIDQTPRGYDAIRLDDEGVLLSDRKLPWHSEIPGIIESSNQWWGDGEVDNLDDLYERLCFIGYIPFEIMDDYIHNEKIAAKA